MSVRCSGSPLFDGQLFFYTATLCRFIQFQPEEIHHLDMFSPQDQFGIQTLHPCIDGPESRHSRRQRIALLQSWLTSLQSFCICNDESDWICCLVCGIPWLSRDEITVNARNLKTILGKNKSSINGALALMDYVDIPPRIEQITRTSSVIPYHAAHNTELRP
jgi:hypothetical protein